MKAGDPISRPIGINPFTPNGRIVGGKPTTIEKVPHQVSLQSYGFSFCGGSIISNNWILTAGHCISVPSEWITIRAGTNKLNSGGSEHAIVKVIRHENYKTGKYGVPENDVALIQLATPLEFDATRQPIKIFNQNEEAVVGAMSIITGWGRTKEGGTSATVLQTVEVPIVSKESCHIAYESYGGLPQGEICAAFPEGGKDACQGDSGGPLTIGGRLAGIVSWGNGCAKKGYPGVYTEVAAYHDWIMKNSEL